MIALMFLYVLLLFCFSLALSFCAVHTAAWECAGRNLPTWYCKASHLSDDLLISVEDEKERVKVAFLGKGRVWTTLCHDVGKDGGVVFICINIIQ